MKEFNWNDFKNGKIVVHCDTEEKANDFLRECNKRDFKWRDGTSLICNNYWMFYKENTYYINNFELTYQKIVYLDMGYISKANLKKTNAQIIEWEVNKMKEFTKSDLKDGMVVEYRNGNLRIKVGEGLYGLDGGINLSNCNENFIDGCGYSELEIIAVYESDIFNTDIFKILKKENLKLIWKRKEQKPVDFITAVMAYYENCKTIKSVVGNVERRYEFRGIGLENTMQDAISATEIIKGKWYIED